MVMVALSTIFSALLIAACLSGIWQMVSHAWPKLSEALAGPVPAPRAAVARVSTPPQMSPIRHAA
jgi:hypothetical protein